MRKFHTHFSPIFHIIHQKLHISIDPRTFHLYFNAEFRKFCVEFIRTFHKINLALLTHVLILILKNQAKDSILIESDSLRMFVGFRISKVELRCVQILGCNVGSLAETCLIVKFLMILSKAGNSIIKYGKMLRI